MKYFWLLVSFTYINSPFLSIILAGSTPVGSRVIWLIQKLSPILFIIGNIDYFQQKNYPRQTQMRVDRVQANNALKEMLTYRRGTRVDPGGAVNNADIARINFWDLKQTNHI
jgi:hypothetical protein